MLAIPALWLRLTQGGRGGYRRPRIWREKRQGDEYTSWRGSSERGGCRKYRALCPCKSMVSVFGVFCHPPSCESEGARRRDWTRCWRRTNQMRLGLGHAEAVIAVTTRHLPRRLSHVEPAGPWPCPNLDQYLYSPNCIIIVELRVLCSGVLLYIFRAPRNQPYPNQCANSLPHFLSMGCEVIYTSLESNQRRRWSNASLTSPDPQSWASHITRPSCISWHISAATSLCDSEIKFNLVPHWKRKKGSPPAGQSPPRTVFCSSAALTR